jgi:hypothetical protein
LPGGKRNHADDQNNQEECVKFYHVMDSTLVSEEMKVPELFMRFPEIFSRQGQLKLRIGDYSSVAAVDSLLRADT